MIVLYDHHEDEAPIKVNQTKHGLSLHIDKHLRNGHNGRVYPVVCVEGCPSSLDTELLDLKGLPSVVHDTRTDVGSYITSPIIPWLLGPEEEYNARSLNFETAQSGYCSDEFFLDGKGPLYDVEQI
ncbi:MAG: hypothetical protein KAT35_06155, partial [Candidatus Aenigmarchaeota archaeon]|nr:hypothetical protein [Candidatus Aenigmarchaeota archaeon]